MQYKLSSTFGTVVHIGTEHECKRIMKSLELFGVSPHKFDLITIQIDNNLTDNTRNELKQAVADIICQGSFGDGILSDYSWNGVVIKGANEMHDPELIDLYESYVDEDDDLLMRAKGEFALEQTLKD